MKRNRFFMLFTAVLLMLSLLTGCGASASSDQAMAEEAPMMNEMASDALAEAGRGGNTPLPENRKWVVTVDMEAETEDMDTLLESVFAQVETLGGYVEDQNVYNGNMKDTYRYRSARLVIRIPAEQVDAFTAQMAENANVVSNSRNLEDITLQYVDTESRLKALEIEEARLLELLEQAETMSDLLEIEGRLTDVRYEKERITSQLRTYDNQVDYATVHLGIQEVREYTPVEEPTVWERISQGFIRSIKGVGSSLLDFGIFLIVASPYLVVWGLIILAVVLIVRKCVRHRKQKPGKHHPAPPEWNMPPEETQK